MLNSVGRNLGVQFLALAVTFADRFVVVGLLLRFWGPQLYADWVVLLSAAGLLQLGELGLNIYYGNIWQRAAATGDQAGGARMLRVAMGIASLQALLLLLFAAVFLAIFDLRQVLTLAGTEIPRLIFLLLALFSILAVVRGSLSQLYRGHGRYRRGMLVTMAGTLALLVSTLLVALAGGELTALATAYLASQIIFGIGLMVWDLKRCFPELQFWPTLPTQAEWHDAWRNTRWLALEQCAPIAWLQLPILVLGLAGINAAALVGFVLLRTLVSFARQVSTMVSIAFGVEWASLVHSDPQRVLHQLSTAGRLLSALAGVLGVAIWLFGAPLLALWSGKAISFDPIVAAWLVVGTWAAAPATPLAKLLAFTNQARPNGIAWIVQLCAGLLLMTLLVHPFGASGAAAGLALGELLGMGLVFPLLAGASPALPIWRYLRDCWTALGLSALWCLLVGTSLIRIIDMSTPAGALTTLVLWGCLGALPAFILAIPAGFRRRLRPQKLVNQWQKA